MALSMRAKTFIGNLSKRGDMLAQGVSEAGGTGYEAVATYTDAEAPSATWIAVSALDNVTSFPVAHATTGTYPRNLTCTFGGSWAGGDITVTGTDVSGNVISEVIADNAGNAVAGVKIFKTVTSWSKESAGSGAGGHTVTIGYGLKIGFPQKLASSFVTVMARASTGDYASSTATIDLTYSAFTPTNAADGSYDYQILYRAL